MAKPFRTLGPQVGRFFQTYYRHTKGPRAGDPFSFEMWQQAFANEWYRVWPDGGRVYRVGLLGIPRGNGKSPLTTGFGVRELVTAYDSPEVYCASGAKEEAQILMDFANSFVELGPLSPYVQCFRRKLLCPQRRGSMTVLSSDGLLQHGKSVSASLIDELHAFERQKQLDLHEALRSSLHKRYNSWELNISTAGRTLDSLLGQMYLAGLNCPDVEQHLDGCLTIARDTDAGFLMVWYGAPEGSSCDDPEVLRRVNPLSTISVRELLRQLKSPGFAEASFRRLHMNQWTRVKDVWMDESRWRVAPYCEAWPPVGVPVYVGVDMAQFNDTAAVALAWRSESGSVNVVAHAWSARKDIMQLGQAHTFVDGGKVPPSVIRQYIRELRSNHGLYVAEVVADPTMFGESIDILEQEGFAIAELNQNSGLMAEAYSGWYAAHNAGETNHPHDPVFTSHVLNADGDKTERGWKVSKRSAKHKIDMLVAAAMARWRAARAEGSVYDERGLISL